MTVSVKSTMTTHGSTTAMGDWLCLSAWLLLSNYLCWLCQLVGWLTGCVIGSSSPCIQFTGYTNLVLTLATLYSDASGIANNPGRFNMANTPAFQLPPYYNAYGVLSFGILLNTADVTANILDNPLQILVETEAKSWYNILNSKVIANSAGARDTSSGAQSKWQEFAVAEPGACPSNSLYPFEL